MYISQVLSLVFDHFFYFYFFSLNVFFSCLLIASIIVLVDCHISFLGTVKARPPYPIWTGI